MDYNLYEQIVEELNNIGARFNEDENPNYMTYIQRLNQIQYQINELAQQSEANNQSILTTMYIDDADITPINFALFSPINEETLQVAEQIFNQNQEDPLYRTIEDMYVERLELHHALNDINNLLQWITSEQCKQLSSSQRKSKLG